MSENNILGVVLAGGKSKRFGKDKSIVKLNNKTLLEYTLDKIKSKLNKIIIVSNNKILNNHITINDCIDGQLGPLVGVLSSMKWIVKNNYSYDWIITFPCDTPFFNISLIDKFVEVSKLNDSLLYFVKTEEKRQAKRVAFIQSIQSQMSIRNVQARSDGKSIAVEMVYNGKNPVKTLVFKGVYYKEMDVLTLNETIMPRETLELVFTFENVNFNPKDLSPFRIALDYAESI